MLKILQARLQIYNSQMYKMGLEKAEEQEIHEPVIKEMSKLHVPDYYTIQP